MSCDFAKVDEAIQDQLIEKCHDAWLRRKFLEKAGDAKLKEMQVVKGVNRKVVIFRTGGATTVITETT